MKLVTKILLISCLTIFLSSCFYSTKYVVKYDINTKTDINQTELDIREVVKSISSQHDLLLDEKYDQTDTLGYFGSPYHYFKYWTSTKDTTIRLTLNYNGSFGKQKSPPYENMLNQLTEDLNRKFIVHNIEIHEKSNRKLSRKNK